MPTRVGFVGRQSELSVLDERLAAARTGDPQVVYLEGEAGAGKSTLLSRFLGSLSGPVVLEVGGDEAETSLTYGVVDQLLPGRSTEPGADPMAVGARLLDLFDQLQGGGQVVVLVIDDLHWADRPSLRAVLFALRRLRADKVLAVVATRPGGLADPGWARFVAGDSRVTHVPLGGLSSGDLTDLASALGLGALSPRAASRLATHTQGNALYCRALLDEIGLVGLSAGDGGLPAPRKLSALILARVAALPPTTQALLAAASVLGQHAPASLIVSVAQLPNARHDMDAAVGAGLLREDLGRSELSFTHPLYRAAIYDDLSPAVRRGLHARAAAVVVGGQRLAQQVAAAVGPDEQLAGELESAALVDADLGDLVAAAWAFERSAYLSPDAGQRERRLLDAAGVQLIAADNAGAARTLAACRGSSARRDALSGLLGVYTGSLDAGNRLLAAWESHDPGTEPEIGARAATTLANWMVISGRSDEALVWADRAVEGTLPGSALHTRARVAQAFALSAAGRSADGLAALDLLPASENEVQAAATDAVIMRGMLKLHVDDLAGAIADLGVAAARLRNGLPASYPGMCLSDLSDAHFRRGDWDAAVTYAQLATSLAMDTDRPVDLARAHARAAQVLAFRGQWAAADAHAGAARAAAQRFPRMLTIAAAAMAATSLAFARADWAGVIKAAEPAREAGPPIAGGLPGMLNWRAFEADALVGLGRLGDAQRALDEFGSAVSHSGPGSAELALTRCRGNLAAAMGDESGAGRAFSQARSITTMAPMPFEVALLNLDDGRRLHGFGRGPQAVARLEEAHEAFSHLGADPFVQACATELATLDVTATAQGPAAVLGLSRAELAVARLVATGLTNREVASQLYVSVKTVEYHLRNSYMKLDITSRRALTALLR
ncbi:MAG TPA: AAA family ATPase [Acidimicrobiales bacterium]|nr:AAA family ATPase [Acidimicrobiales bacterium]